MSSVSVFVVFSSLPSLYLAIVLMLMKVMVKGGWDGVQREGEGVNCMHGDGGVRDKAKNIQREGGRARSVMRGKWGL